MRAMTSRHAGKHRVGGVTDDELTGASYITLRQSLFPVGLVTTLFLLWGFALLDVLNKYFQEVLHVSRVQSAGLQSAYFGAYFIGPLTYSGWVLRRYGYKVTFILGLCIYGVGALMFWPSAVKRSFEGFCGGMFILGSGLSTLETAANPFIATCGPPKYSEVRLNLAQAVQGTGSIIAPVLASQVFFTHESGSNDLRTLQYVYMGVSCFTFCLAAIFYFAPLPEITDADMANLVAEVTGGAIKRPKRMRQERTLLFGVVAQFCYIGAQCSIAGFFINTVTEMNPGLSSAKGSMYLSISNAVFAMGRVIAGVSMKFIRPRYVLLVYLTACIAFTAASMHAMGRTGIIMLTILMFFESCCYPTIFSLSLRGLGANTKRGASYMVASVSGGAVFPALTGAVGDLRHSTRFAMCVPLFGMCIAWLFPLYCNVYERERLDGLRDSNVGLVDERRDEESASVPASSEGSTSRECVEKLEKA